MMKYRIWMMLKNLENIDTSKSDKCKYYVTKKRVTLYDKKS